MSFVTCSENAVHRNAATLQHRKQQRRDDDADWMIAAQERDGDSGEAIVVRKAIVVTITIAHHFVYPNHARQRAGDGHGDDDLLANRDAAILSRRWAGPSGAQLITPLRSPQKEIDEQATNQRQDESEVQWYPFRKSRNELAEPGDMRARADLSTSA